ncbi:MAG TPA: hypothetical protein VLA36_02980 [Longimicrobiales bacterium]|nr:hypothetical protein [Longimicrobiales bacterium]
MKTGARTGGEGGFALAMVVLLLFAIAVAGVTGFQVASNEFTLATQNRDSQEALIIARGGLQRFLGETVGVVGDSVSYAIGNGIATVTTRKVVEQDSVNHLYYIRSEGAVADARSPGFPAVRVVAEYAWHRLSPIPLNGALWVSGGTTTLDQTAFGTAASANGLDQAAASDCVGGGTTGTAGVVKGSGPITVSGGATYTGNPPSSTYSGYQAMYDTTGIRWDILSSPNFPVDFDGAPPNFASLPSDSFPIVRHQGDLTAHYPWSGRGVLIVTGRFTPGWGFQWDGIILAGSLGSVPWYSPIIRGMLIAGLNGPNPDVTVRSGTYRYHSCNAYKANWSLSYLEVVDNTLFEVNG